MTMAIMMMTLLLMIIVPNIIVIISIMMLIMHSIVSILLCKSSSVCYLWATKQPMTVSMANVSRKQETMTIKVLTKITSPSEAVKQQLIASCWLRMLGCIGGGNPSSRNGSSKPRCSGSLSSLVSDDRPIRPFGHVQSSISRDPLRLAKRTQAFHASMTDRRCLGTGPRCAI